jgi:hypothetical protein
MDEGRRGGASDALRRLSSLETAHPRRLTMYRHIRGRHSGVGWGGYGGRRQRERTKGRRSLVVDLSTHQPTPSLCTLPRHPHRQGTDHTYPLSTCAPTVAHQIPQAQQSRQKLTPRACRLAVPNSSTHTHAHTHSHTQTIHEHIHSHSHTLTHTHIHIHSHTHARTPLSPGTHPIIHTTLHGRSHTL